MPPARRPASASILAAQAAPVEAKGDPDPAVEAAAAAISANKIAAAQATARLEQEALKVVKGSSGKTGKGAKASLGKGGLGGK